LQKLLFDIFYPILLPFNGDERGYKEIEEPMSMRGKKTTKGLFVPEPEEIPTARSQYSLSHRPVTTDQPDLYFQPFTNWQMIFEHLQTAARLFSIYKLSYD